MTGLGVAVLTLGIMAAAVGVVVAIVRWIDVAVSATLILVALGVAGLPTWGLGHMIGWWP